MPPSESFEEILKERSLLVSGNVTLAVPHKACQTPGRYHMSTEKPEQKEERKNSLIRSFAICVLYYIYCYQNKQLREYRVDGS